MTMMMMMVTMTMIVCRHDVVHVYLRDKCPEWIRNRHPTGSVPVLETDDGRVLYESLVCAQYADDANPQSRLTPTDAFTKAKHALLICEWEKVESTVVMSRTHTTA